MWVCFVNHLEGDLVERQNLYWGIKISAADRGHAISTERD